MQELSLNEKESERGGSIEREKGGGGGGGGAFEKRKSKPKQTLRYVG